LETATVETIVVGAGAIGLAIGAEFARSGAEAFVLESEGAIGGGISSRNSEVIHSGIYYPYASLKHRLCVEGRRLLYAYCDAHHIATRKCGKLIVATSQAELPTIEAIAKQGARNGVEGVEFLDGAAARALEPALASVGALHVRETGIIDSHAYMAALAGEIADGQGGVLLRHRMTSGRRAGQGFEIEVETPDGALRIATGRLVLAGGLSTHALAARLAGYDRARAPPLTLAKGSYFSCRHAPAFSRLIYPTPVEGGLGAHLTLDLAGRMRFGPDVEWLDSDDPGEIDFAVDPERSHSFYQSVRRYWPDLPDGALAPDYSGVRPKLSRRGEPAADFFIDGPQEHGIAGLVALYGIESPGLTASLALARYVAERLN
jgi:L-2-hydroxyglutarate oxidase LhgO